jgi:hypothetical protein
VLLLQLQRLSPLLTVDAVSWASPLTSALLRYEDEGSAGIKGALMSALSVKTTVGTFIMMMMMI